MTRPPQTDPPTEAGHSPTEADVTEVALLLPAEHLAALELVAHRSGVTAAQLLRRLVRDVVAADASARAAY